MLDGSSFKDPDMFYSHVFCKTAPLSITVFKYIVQDNIFCFNSECKRFRVTEWW